MESDRDITTWEKRLKDQAVRHWENYVHRRIDLSVARVDELLAIPGEFVFVEDAYDEDTSVAQIKFQKNTNDALDLEQGVEIYTVFTQVFISNEALEDEWLDLIFGINFIYKKKIGDGFTNPITTAPGVDLVLLPGAGGITQIGDAGAQSRGLVNNDDLFVSGKLQVLGFSWFEANSYFSQNTYVSRTLGLSGTQAMLRFDPGVAFGDAEIRELVIHELLTVAVGTGAAGVVTAANLAPANSTILGVMVRVTQAPGGGATTIDIGRTGGGNTDEFIDGIATGLGTTGTFAANHDALTTGPVLNAADDTLTLTTDADVLVTDMKVRIAVFYRREYPPTS